MEQLKGLIILRGVSGSGKSTLAETLRQWYVEHYKDDLNIYEIDQYFVDSDGVYNFQGDQIPEAVEWTGSRIWDELQRTGRAIVANTHTRIWEMDMWLASAVAQNIPTVVIHVQGEFESIHNLPPGVVERQRERWEPMDGEFHVPVTENDSGLDIVVDIWQQVIDSRRTFDV